MRIKACFGCTRRTVGCHATCQEYKDERAALDAHMVNVRSQKKAENDMTELRKEGVKKALRKREGH